MARSKGTLGISANFEPQIAASFDARANVPTKADLTIASNWTANDGGSYPYNGMTVTVAEDSTSSNNGIYILLDASNITDINSWQQVGEGTGFPFTGSAQITGSLGVTGSISVTDKVGVGTDSPTQTLHVNSSTTDAVAKFQSSDTKAFITIEDNGDQGFVGVQTDRLALGTNVNFTSTDNVYIKNDGNVGIGTISPPSKLTVQGDISASGAFRGDGSALTGITLSTVLNTGNIAGGRSIFMGDGEGSTGGSIKEVNSISAVSITASFTGSLLGTATTASYIETAQTASYVLNAVSASQAQTASYVETAQTASYVTLAQTASYITLAQTASYVETAQTASYVTLAQTASYVLNAVSSSYALSASFAPPSTLQQVLDTGNTATQDLTLNGSLTVNTIEISTGSHFTNTAIGNSALTFADPQIGTTAVGYFAMNKNTGSFSTAVGRIALQNNSGSYSNGVGYQSLENNTGEFCSGFGVQTLQDNVGDNCVGFGHRALQNNQGNFALGFGFRSLRVNQGTLVSGFGYQAAELNTGRDVNAFGYFSLRDNSGDYSNGFGRQTLRNNTGNYNTAIGDTSGYETSALTGQQNTFLGFNASYGVNTAVRNSVALGANTTVSQDYTVILGEEDNTSIEVGIGTNTPSAKLHIIGPGTTSAQTPLLVQNDQNGTPGDLLKVTSDGTVTINDLLSIPGQDPLPTPSSAGVFAVSSSSPPRPYFWDGSSWLALV